jgi:uncharacterized protein YcfL
MRNIFSLLVSLLLLISCSEQDNQRKKIEEEKEKLRIEAQAKEEFLMEEEQKALNNEIKFLALRVENLYSDLNKASTDREKLEVLAYINVLSQSILDADYSFFWLESMPEGEFKKLKSFDIEFSPKEITREFSPNEETEKMVKAKIYLEAKKMGGTGVINLKSENGKLSGEIISTDTI